MIIPVPLRFSLKLLIFLWACFPISWAQAGSDAPTVSGWANNDQQNLTEKMLIDGRGLLEQGLYSEAESLLFEALQLVKINSGVASTRQIPVLALLIESLLPQQDWKTIQQYLAYFDWLNSKLYRTNLVDFLNSTETLSSLYLQVAADETNPHSAHYLVAAKSLYWNAVSAIERAHGGESRQLTPWLYKIVLSHFYQSTLVKRRGLTSYSYKTDAPAIVNGWSLSKNESLRKSYNIGAQILRRIRDIESAGGNKQAAAIAWLYLADWETTFANGARALEFYQKANRLFLNSGADQDTVDALFAQTSVLPEPSFELSLANLIAQPAGSTSTKIFRAWSTNFPTAAIPATLGELAAAGQADIHAEVSFDYNLVSAAKLPTNEAINRSLFTKSNLTLVSISQNIGAAQALHDVSLLHLRPQLVGGELVTSEGITVDYVFPRQAVSLLFSDN